MNISLILTILNGTDILIKKITMYDSSRDMYLWERTNFQSLSIKYINNGKIFTKDISKSDINTTQFYEFIIKNNIFEIFEIHTIIIYIIVCFMLLFIVLLINIVQNFYKKL